MSTLPASIRGGLGSIAHDEKLIRLNLSQGYGVYDAELAELFAVDAENVRLVIANFSDCDRQREKRVK